METQTVVVTLVQLGVALAGSAVLVQLLTLRQSRNKIAGEANTAEANAASTLSGAALELVELSRTETKEAKEELSKVRKELAVTQKQLNEICDEHADLTRRVEWLERREARLLELLREAGIEPPEHPRWW